jgi:hypothetical protein
LPRKPPAKAPRPTKPRKRAEAGADILDALDEKTLAYIQEMLDAGFDEEDPLALFDELLVRLEADGEAQIQDDQTEDDDDFFNALVASLTQTSIDANGGDPGAREIKAAVLERLDAALKDKKLEAAGLVLVAKILNDSGWTVPESLKSEVVDLLESAGVAAEGGSGDLTAALSDIAEAAEGDPFAAYDAVNSVLAAFPSEAAARMVATLGSGRKPVLLHTLAGFAMHRDPRLAIAAIEELRRAARSGRVESALVERLVRMRPWLPADRQGPLDETIRALRAQAQAPVEAERPTATKCFVMACDGSGAAGTLASLRDSGGWRFVAAMTKAAGVEEVLSLEGLRKAEADATLRGMRGSVTAAATDVEGVSRYLQIALGENLAAKNPPPFKLIRFVESLGLGPIAPRVLSPADLIAEMLEDLPETEKNAAAVARAHKNVLGGALEETWFEAGEPVERLLAPLKGRARVKAVLESCLPERRAFWTRACALTAFALRLDRKAYGALGRDLALVGRDIASGAAFEDIALMRQIAGMTVRAYESRK